MSCDASFLFRYLSWARDGVGTYDIIAGGPRSRLLSPANQATGAVIR